jgi:hypothetical protein
MRPIALSLGLLAASNLLASTAQAAEDTLIVPTFSEETTSAGIDSVYAGDWQYMVGGGAASFDCNDDGFAELLLAGGEKPANFYRNASTRGGTLTFVKQASGLELDAVTGAYPIDIDNDGRTDLVLLRIGESVVMRGLGGCKFERANEAWNFAGGDAWATAFAATWEHGNAWPTLAIGAYVDRNEDTYPWGTCTDNLLMRPQAADARKFAAPLPLKPSYCPLSMLFTDWNRSGTPSLRVSNDREYYKGGQEQMWKLPPGQPPALYSQAEGWKYLRIWGMGIASYDLNGDRYPDYFLRWPTTSCSRWPRSPKTANRNRPMPTSPSPRAPPPTDPIPATTGIPRPPGTPHSRTSTMTAGSTCSLPRAMSPRWRILPERTPTTC